MTDEFGVDRSDDDATSEHGYEILAFWETARIRANLVRISVVTGMSPEAAVPPPVVSLGDTPEETDRRLDLVLAGTKTAAAALEVELEDGELPERGDLCIAVDGLGHPRALLRTTSVDVVPLSRVDDAYVVEEGEGPTDVASWREARREGFAAVVAERGGRLDGDTRVVLERFELLFSIPGAH